MTHEVLSINFRDTFPVFPLPDCVLLPNTLMPLRIFEPRYSRMISDTLDGLGLVAMGLFQDDVTACDYFHGNPELRQFVCLGHIRHYEPLSGGRYVIVLQGVCRARILDEPSSYPYRRIRLQPVDVSRRDETQLVELRQELVSLIRDPELSHLEPFRESGAEWTSSTVSTSALVDVVASNIAKDAETRYRLLAEPSLVERARWLAGYLKAWRSTLAEGT